MTVAAEPQDADASERPSSGTFRATLTVPVLLVSLGFAVAFALTYLVFIQTAAGQYVDAASFGAYSEINQQFSGLGGFLRDQLPLGVAAVAALLGVVALEQRRFRVAGVAAAQFVVAAGTSELLKTYLLPRPALGDYGYEWNTFPAGQTTVITSLCLAILILLPPKIWRQPVVAVCFVTSIATGIAAFITFAHRPADTFGSVLLVGVFAVPAAAASGVKVVGRWPLWWGVVGGAAVAAAGLLFWRRYHVLIDGGSDMGYGVAAPVLALTGGLLLVYTGIAAVTPRKQPD